MLAMFGIVFTLTILPGGCPPEYAKARTLGCVEYWKSPARVYMRPGMPKRLRAFVLRHELGHVACYRRDPALAYSERCATRWANHRMPTRKKKGRT